MEEYKQQIKKMISVIDERRSPSWEECPICHETVSTCDCKNKALGEIKDIIRKHVPLITKEQWKKLKAL